VNKFNFPFSGNIFFSVIQFRANLKFACTLQTNLDKTSGSSIEICNNITFLDVSSWFCRRKDVLALHDFDCLPWPTEKAFVSKLIRSAALEPA
jgi:hypothetical protein